MICALIVVAFAGAARGDDDAAALLKKLASRYASAKTVSVKFSEVGPQGKFTGTAIVADGKTFRVQLAGRTIVCDGATVWNYTAADKRVTIDSYRPASRTLSPEFFLTKLPADAHASLLASPRHGRKLLQLMPDDPNAWGIIKKLTVETDDDGSMMYAVTVVDQSDGEQKITVLSTKLDEHLPADTFTFTPPAGATVMDLR